MKKLIVSLMVVLLFTVGAFAANQLEIFSWWTGGIKRFKTELFRICWKK